MNKEQREIYDRSIRVWGRGTQLKIIESRCLLINLDGINFELAKNLSLTGLSLIYKNDSNDEVITEDDVNSNFYISKSEMSQQVKKSDIFIKKIYDMTNLITISRLQEDSIYDYISISFKDLDSISEINNVLSNDSKNYYINFSIGNFGFIFSNGFNRLLLKNLSIFELNNNFWTSEFKKINTKKQLKSKMLLIVFHYYIYLIKIFYENMLDKERIKELLSEKVNEIIYFHDNFMPYTYNDNYTLIDLVCSINDNIEEKMTNSIKIKQLFHINQLISGIISHDIVDNISNLKTEGNNYLYCYFSGTQEGRFHS
jgi:hypothetical protein